MAARPVRRRRRRSRAQRTALPPVLVGSEADRPRRAQSRPNSVRSATRAAGPRSINLAGRTDLPQLAGVLALCAAFVSNDSGAMHLAAAVGMPVVALFGPTDERVTAPLAPARARADRRRRGAGRACCASARSITGA